MENRAAAGGGHSGGVLHTRGTQGEKEERGRGMAVGVVLMVLAAAVWLFCCHALGKFIARSEEERDDESEGRD